MGVFASPDSPMVRLIHDILDISARVKYGIPTAECRCFQTQMRK